MTRTGTGSTFVLRINMGLIFAYIFLPLGVMAAAGVNFYSPLSITIRQGFTLQWFAELWSDGRMWPELLNSLIILVCVMALALPKGLSWAFLLSQPGRRSVGIVSTVMVSPLLTPGLIIGISTVILWRKLGTTARLQRQGHTLEEAALGLGATWARAFRCIALRFLRLAIVTAAVITLLQSFENYTTTIFATGGVTVICAVLWSLLRQRERQKEAAA